MTSQTTAASHAPAPEPRAGGTPAGIPPEIPTVDPIAALSSGTPCTAETLTAAIEVMETARGQLFRTVANLAGDAERLAVGLGRVDLQMRALLVQADMLINEGHTVESGRIAHRVHAWALEHGDRQVLTRSHYHLSVFYRHIGDLATALAHAVQSLSHMPDDTKPLTRARHLAVLAIALNGNGSFDEGTRRFQEALDIATTLGDTEMVMNLLNNMAYAAYENHDPVAADDLVARILDLHARTGAELHATALDTIARIQMMSGRYAEAEATLAPVLRTVEDPKDEVDTLAECLLTLATIRHRRGHLAGAQDVLDTTRRICADRDLAVIDVRLREEQAHLLAATGRYREAYEEHCAFYAASQALQSAERDARARALQAVFEAEEARQASERFREMAYRDPLTGLHNRRYVNERLSALLATAAERHSPLSAALLDLDYFKRINDTLSHDAGDAVLQQVAGLLAAAAAACGTPTIAARLGGEEFLLVFAETDAEQAMRYCEELRQRIRSHPWQPVTGTLPVTVSIGVTTVSDGRITASALLSQADRNLYTAKRSGRDRVAVDPCEGNTD